MSVIGWSFRKWVRVLSVYVSFDLEALLYRILTITYIVLIAIIYLKALAFFTATNYELLKRASESITKDEGFNVPSVTASSALLTATNLNEWMFRQENEVTVITFLKELVEYLKGCIMHSGASQKTRRERMWRNFHTLRVSESFKRLWHDFFVSADIVINPL